MKLDIVKLFARTITTQCIRCGRIDKIPCGLIQSVIQGISGNITYITCENCKKEYNKRGKATNHKVATKAKNEI